MALDSEGLLSGSTQRALFTKEGRRFNREVSVESHTDGNGDASGTRSSEDLLAAVARRLAISVYTRVATFAACVVRVNESDGMSWSAQACYERLRSEYPQHHFRLFARNRPVGGLPAIMALVPIGTLIKVATKYGLLPRRSRLPWLAALAAACVLAAAPRYLEFLKDRFGTLYPLLAGVLTVVIPIVTDHIRSASKRDRILGELAVRLGEDTEAVAAVADAPALRWLPNLEFPRFVIIDGYQSLDPFSRRVVKQFFAGPDDAPSDEWYHQPILERWLVFEEIGGGEPLVALTPMGPSGPSSPRMAKTVVLRQETLDRQSRQRLAELVGRPERAGFTSVKSICEQTAAGADKQIAAIKMFRKAHAPAPESANALDLLFLLSVASEDCPLRFSVKSLADDLVPERLLRSRLLRLILRGARLTRAEIHDCIQDLREGCHGVALIETEPGRPAGRACR
jgi:hypothetical protein